MISLSTLNSFQIPQRSKARLKIAFALLLAGVTILKALPMQAAEVDSPKPLSGSSLAPERPLRNDFSPDVEALLGKIGAQVNPGLETHLLIRWEVSLGKKLNWDRNSIGPDSYRSSLSWYPPPEGVDFPQTQTLCLAASGDRVRIFELDGNGNPREWWHLENDLLYSSRMQELEPFITRWRFIQALESDMLSYGEGLGLILWSLNPEAYLRRAEHLSRAGLKTVNGKAYETLISTPDWIANPPTLPNRRYYPFNQSVLASWATFTPVITYFIDPDTWAIEGSLFEYYSFERSHRGRWTVLPKRRGERLEAWVKKWVTTPEGLRVPQTIEAVRIQGDKVTRRILITVEDEASARGTVTSLSPLNLERGRRQVEPWPPFQSQVWRARIEAGENDYANRVGLIKALAFEGDLSSAFAELKSLISDLRSDNDLIPESTGGIDWELGLAVYEILQNPQSPEYQRLWTDFDPLEPYKTILARAIDYFARWHLSENASVVEDAFRRYEAGFGIKARLLYTLNRKLIPRVETENDRALELERILFEATEDTIRLRALQGAVECYLASGNLEAASRVIQRAAALFVSQEGQAAFEKLNEDWQARIDKGFMERLQAETASRIGALNDLIAQLKGRYVLAKERGSSREAVRLEKLIAAFQAELESLSR